MTDETQHQPHLATPPEEVTLDVSHTDPTAAVLHEEVPQTAPSDDTTHAAIQSAAEAQQPQPVWNPATGQYYYPSVAGQPGSETYMSTDYNINMTLPTDHYVTAAGDDFSGVAATLSNWAEANPTDDVTNGGLPLVAPPVNGDPGLDVHVPVNGDMSAGAPVLTEKPKKLVLACHFCRGRKLK
jgi:hypothetical protein